MTSTSSDITHVGFIGLGDQGAPMARAIAEAGFTLHVWARRSASLAALDGIRFIAERSVTDLGVACDLVGLCLSQDRDNLSIATDAGLVASMRADTVLVNHGTGTPSNAALLAEICAAAGVDSLDAPVSGGRPAAEERRLTTMVGGPKSVADRCTPVFKSFSRHVVYQGQTGAGQVAKLFNNALLMMNQASIAEIVDLAVQMGLDPVPLVEVLKLGSASSQALTLLNTMVRLENVDHLSGVEVIDMKLFKTAMAEAGVSADAVTARGLAGANGLPALVRRLNS